MALSGTAPNLLLVLMSFPVSLLLAELALRVAGFYAPIFIEPDPIVGSFHRPNLEFIYTDEGRGLVRINGNGLRDREHTFEKPSDVYRIAVLRDSFSQALQVNQEETFWSILESKLNECHFMNKRVEIINFGIQ